MDGFAVLNVNERIIGYITYRIHGSDCEIISLDSIEEGKGIGTSLVKEVEHLAKDSKCKQVKVITTNDNLHALKFYQKRDYHLMELYRDAVAEARKRKPEISQSDNDGIPIRDELLLTKSLV